MALSPKAINEQGTRLLRLPFAPKEAGDVSAWTKDFKRIVGARCVNDEHLAKVADRLMDTAQRCPIPSDVIGACNDTPPPGSEGAPRACGLCVEGRRQRDSVHGGYSFVVFCGCELGQWLKAKQR